jgi:hypothetical protein
MLKVKKKYCVFLIKNLLPIWTSIFWYWKSLLDLYYYKFYQKLVIENNVYISENPVIKKL